MFNKLRFMPPNLVVYVFMGLFAVSAFAVKPDKPGGGGKPPAEKDNPVAVVSVVTSIVIDGYMDDWDGIKPEPKLDPKTTCKLFPQYWAGKVWKNKVANGKLAESCVVVSNGLVYVAGWATPGNAINDKEISTHIKFNGFEMVSNVDHIVGDLDDTQPMFAYIGTGFNSEGWPIAMAYEASFFYPFYPGEVVEVIIHVSSCPEFDCNDGSGQSARTLKSFLGVVFP
jgi:hypothetical protein